MAEFSLFKICFTANLALNIHIFWNMIVEGGTSYFLVIALLFGREAGGKKKSSEQSMQIMNFMRVSFSRIKHIFYCFT